MGKPDGNVVAPEQTLTLVDDCLPPLVAGTYTVKVEQTVQHANKILSQDAKPTFEKAAEFTVSAPRFALSTSDIYDRYPPADATGRFSETLPHIVLSRRTLPWERALNGDDRKTLVRPWMALLLLDEDDLLLNTLQERKPQSRAVTDIAKAETGIGTLVSPKLGDLPPWEQDDRCLSLDLPWELFQQIAPSWDDLPYLAHARQLGHTQHMEAEGIDDEGWFAVVVGNRLPTPNKEHRAVLVSLEGHEARITGSLSFEAPTDNKATIRLVVLAHWRFVDLTHGKNFKGLVEGLKCGPLRLSGKDDQTSDQAKKINAVLEFGYVPLPHQTGEGYQTVAWYRGPLVPHFLPTEPRNEVYTCADAALRYDREQGLFDVSYAAAWQLGRLLALQNQPFARAVCQLKLRVAHQGAAAAAKAALCNRFGLKDVTNWEDAARPFFKPPSGTNGTGQPSESRDSTKETDPYSAMKQELQNAQVELLPDMRQSLARMFLLHGVPLIYLVPHPSLLPEESLRFFYVDTTWIAALMDGALSIGRTPESRLLLDKAMAGNFLKEVAEKEMQVSLTTDKELGVPDATGSEVLGHVTGFLLRSELVSGWRGVEVQAEDGTKPLKALRLQKVAKDTLLVIFNGHIRKVVITQPPQGMNFAPSDSTVQKLNFKQLAGQGSPATLCADLLQKRVQLTIDLDVQGSNLGPLKKQTP